MPGLKEHQQAAFIGVMTIFYRIAMIAAKGIVYGFIVTAMIRTDPAFGKGE